MASSTRLLNFRFAIGLPGSRQSSVWRTWSHNSDVYVTQGDMGKVHKLSVHALAPHYFYGLTSEFAAQHTGGRRDLMKWRRGSVPAAGEKRAARVVWAVFPTDYLGPDSGHHHGIHWIPAAPDGEALQVDMIVTRESRAAIEAAFVSNGRRLEEYALLPNGDAFAVVSSVMSDWQNEDVLLRGGPDFANVAFRAADEKGADRSEILCMSPPPKDGDAMQFLELWGNHVPPDFPVPPGMKILTGGPGAIRSSKS